jgi:hypothetical protein
MSSLMTIFFGNIHGYIGAIVLGLNAVLFDIFWQWLRVKIIRKNKASYLIGGIIGGLAARVVSVFLFIQLGSWWLGKGSSYFMTFAACLLTIPLWALIVARKFKLEKLNNGSLK